MRVRPKGDVAAGVRDLRQNLSAPESALHDARRAVSQQDRREARQGLGQGGASRSGERIPRDRLTATMGCPFSTPIRGPVSVPFDTQRVF